MWTEKRRVWYSVCVPEREQCGTVYVGIGQETVWHTICGSDREQCGKVYVERTGNSVVQCMWTGQGTVWYSLCGPYREQSGTVYVDWTGNSVVHLCGPDTEHIISERRKLRGTIFITCTLHRTILWY